MSEFLQIERVRFPSPQLERILGLHRLNSRTLGFLPVGAFEEHARLGQIIAALEGDELLGYLLYRVARERAAIVHLCVASNARGRGISRLLVEQLKQDTKHLEGIGLRCRRDYDINHLWSKFGFEAVSSKAGRGRDGAELTFWWFSHGHPDLLSRATQPDPIRQRMVIDANVFYDLHFRSTPESEDSKALLADWVQASIEIVITKELRNEIEKAPDEELRRASRAEATRYLTLPSDDRLFQRLCAELRSLFPESVTLRDEADLRQVAYAVAGNASFFVTRDQTLIERGEPLYRSHGLMLLHPAELINHLDAIERDGDYKPARIEGSRLKNTLLRTESLASAVESFKARGERVNDFMQSLRHYLSQPRSADVQLISDHADMPVILGVMDRQHADVLGVPVLRRALHPLAPTMLRNFLRACLNAAATEGRNAVIVQETRLAEGEVNILREFGFVSCGATWGKLTLRALGSLDEIGRAVARLPVNQMLSPAKAAAEQSVAEAVSLHSPEAAIAIESQLWPVKVTGINVPTFIVAIRPEWAQHFFDAELGSQLLFGLREDLHLGVEGAYYRSVENNNLAVPGRILWYVSKGSGDGSMSIKACSQLEEVIVGKPKDLFRRFQRLGVFEWKDVYAVANRDIQADIVAFRFRMTERFKTPVDLNVLATFDIRGPFMSPRRINETQFAAIYRIGSSLP